RGHREMRGYGEIQTSARKTADETAARKTTGPPDLVEVDSNFNTADPIVARGAGPVSARKIERERIHGDPNHGWLRLHRQRNHRTPARKRRAGCGAGRFGAGPPGRSACAHSLLSRKDWRPGTCSAHRP